MPINKVLGWHNRLKTASNYRARQIVSRAFGLAGCGWARNGADRLLLQARWSPPVDERFYSECRGVGLVRGKGD